VNLDPAVKAVPFGANIDIRDTVDYKEVGPWVCGLVDGWMDWLDWMPDPLA